VLDRLLEALTPIWKRNGPGAIAYWVFAGVFLVVSSGLRQADQRLSSAARARLTFAKTSEALAVQTKGFGLSLCLSM